MISRDKANLGFVTDHWSEIFEEVILTGLPLQYASAIIIHFKEGKSWYFENNISMKNFKIEMSELLEDYKEYIINVDIKINTKQVRTDVENAVLKLNF